MDNPLPPITDEDRQFLHYNPNTDDIVAWVRSYAESARAEVLEVLRELIAAQEAMGEGLRPTNWPEGAAAFDRLELALERARAITSAKP